MLISGALLQGSSLLVMAGIGSQAVLSHSTRVGISALFTISYVGWCVGWGPISHIITSEIPTTRTFFLLLPTETPPSSLLPQREEGNSHSCAVKGC
jgi:hypothetical protein